MRSLHPKIKSLLQLRKSIRVKMAVNKREADASSNYVQAMRKRELDEDIIRDHVRDDLDMAVFSGELDHEDYEDTFNQATKGNLRAKTKARNMNRPIKIGERVTLRGTRLPPATVDEQFPDDREHGEDYGLTYDDGDSGIAFGRHLIHESDANMGEEGWE